MNSQQDLDEFHNRVCIPAGGRCLCPDLTATYVPEPEMPDFIEDTTSVRGPGWGTRICPHCDDETFGGYESVTKEAMWEHFEHCTVLHPGKFLVHPSERTDVDLGYRICPKCRHQTHSGTFLSTAGMLSKHQKRECSVLHPDPREPKVGTLDALLWRTFSAGWQAEESNRRTPELDDFYEWRSNL